MVLDGTTNEIIIDNAETSYSGLKEFLKRFTSLNQRGFKSVMHQAWRNGKTTYIPDAYDEHQYSIAVVRIPGPGQATDPRIEREYGEIEETHDHSNYIPEPSYTPMESYAEILGGYDDSLYSRRGKRRGK